MRSVRLAMSDSGRVEVLPRFRSGEPMAYCLMFYDYDSSLQADWLSTVDHLFETFQQRPALVIGSLGTKQAKGPYERARSKLEGFLDDKSSPERPDIRVDSEHEFEREQFMPCRMRVAWSRSLAGIDQGVIAVRADAAPSLNEMVEMIAGRLFKKLGVAYAHAFEFPATFGPDFYLSSVGSVPPGYSTTENAGYQERLTRWRDNTWHGKKRPRQGYLREVYPINFLTEEQAGAVFGQDTLKGYMTRTGTLNRCSFNEAMYRWDVPDDVLDRAREDLERSGVVLSSIAS